MFYCSDTMFTHARRHEKHTMLFSAQRVHRQQNTKINKPKQRKENISKKKTVEGIYVGAGDRQGGRTQQAEPPSPSMTLWSRPLEPVQSRAPAGRPSGSVSEPEHPHQESRWHRESTLLVLRWLSCRGASSAAGQPAAGLSSSWSVGLVWFTWSLLWSSLLPVGGLSISWV